MGMMEIFCNKCGQEKHSDEFYFNKRRGVYGKPCKQCQREKMNEYRKAHADTVKESKKQYYRKNKKKIQEKYRAWQQNNREYVRQYQAVWVLKNIDKHRGYNNKRNERMKNEVYDYYGRQCVCCGETIEEFLTIDHINNDGAEHRKDTRGAKIYEWLIKNNFPDGFQVLCMNCNIGKYKNNGICPHQDPMKVQRLSVRSTAQAIGAGSAKPHYVGDDIVRSTWKQVAVPFGTA